MAVGYLLAGYPEKNSFFDILSACEKAGLDIFEIGYPSEHPDGDGEIIRKAHKSADISLQFDLSYWKELRSAVNVPIWVMAYEKDLIGSGFYRELVQNGLVDAFVIPDASFERRLNLLEELRPFGVDVLGFVNPNTDQAEQEACFSAFPLVYQQLYTGPTGMPVEAEDYEEILSRAKTYDDVLVFAGFGITSAKRAEQLLNSGFDGIVVGTAMISKLNISLEELAAFVQDLHETVSKVR